MNTGAAIAIGGNVVIERITPSSRNFIGKRSRASAYAAKEPITSAIAVVVKLMIALLRSACVKSLFLKIEL